MCVHRRRDRPVPDGVQCDGEIHRLTAAKQIYNIFPFHQEETFPSLQVGLRHRRGATADGTVEKCLHPGQMKIRLLPIMI